MEFDIGELQLAGDLGIIKPPEANHLGMISREGVEFSHPHLVGLINIYTSLLERPY